MIDTHAHLDFDDFQEDREAVISRFFADGSAQNSSSIESGRGKAIVNVGVDLERSRKSIEIAEKYENIYAAAGFHPDFFSKAENDLRFTINDLRKKINELKILAKNKKVVAIGECGLDYFSHTENEINEEQKENQKRGFLAQIKIAKSLDLPVIVHCRSAFDDLYEIIKNFQFSIFPAGAGPRQGGGNFQTNPNEQISKNKNIPARSEARQGRPNTKYKIPDTKFVLHCYSGEKKDTEKFLELPNVYFSFSGNITYPKPVERAEKLAEAVRLIPLERIMLDSDAPFLAPQEFRGKRNEPIFIKYIAKKIAEIKGISFKEVDQVTDENAIGFFKLS